MGKTWVENSKGLSEGTKAGGVHQFMSPHFSLGCCNAVMGRVGGGQSSSIATHLHGLRDGVGSRVPDPLQVLDGVLLLLLLSAVGVDAFGDDVEVAAAGVLQVVLVGPAPRDVDAGAVALEPELVFARDHVVVDLHPVVEPRNLEVVEAAVACGACGTENIIADSRIALRVWGGGISDEGGGLIYAAWDSYIHTCARSILHQQQLLRELQDARGGREVPVWQDDVAICFRCEPVSPLLSEDIKETVVRFVCETACGYMSSPAATRCGWALQHKGRDQHEARSTTSLHHSHLVCEVTMVRSAWGTGGDHLNPRKAYSFLACARVVEVKRRLCVADVIMLYVRQCRSAPENNAARVQTIAES